MSAKALSIAAEIRDELAKRFATVSAVGADAILIGTGAAGSQSATVKVIDAAAPTGAVDGIGLQQRTYGTPVVVQVVVETSGSANVAVLNSLNLLTLLGSLSFRGSRIELYMSANGDDPVAAEIVAGNLKATFDPNLKYKLQAEI